MPGSSRLACTIPTQRQLCGEVLTTDGPFAESKDHLGGFYLIDSPDLDAAIAWAAKVSEAIGHPIEVRPFAGVAWEPGG